MLLSYPSVTRTNCNLLQDLTHLEGTTPQKAQQPIPIVTAMMYHIPDVHAVCTLSQCTAAFETTTGKHETTPGWAYHLNGNVTVAVHTTPDLS
jgi:hypothetical protein